MILLWATRGRTWGFRFLPVDGTGPDADPLPLYERAFSGHEDEDEGCWRTDGLLAVRLRDPEGRADEAGRIRTSSCSTARVRTASPRRPTSSGRSGRCSPSATPRCGRPGPGLTGSPK